MKRSRSLLLLAAVVPWVGVVPSRGADIAITPKPKLVQQGDGTFTVTAQTPVRVEGPDGDAAMASGWLKDHLGVTVNSDAGNAAAAKPIVLSTKGADASLGDEGYTLDVTADGVTIRAPHAAGLFYGAVSLTELMPPAVFGTKPGGDTSTAAAAWTAPVVHIVDQPRFSWRGQEFDVSRHFESKADVLQLLDQMAMHKLNVFHWHLTDDQGWRIEIKKYPKLTSVGAWRDSAGFGMDPKLSTTYGPDGKYGGFYTQEEAKEVVAYAAARHIMVVPEIEMPGHASAALRAYPEFGVPMTPSTDAKGDAGIFNGVYDPSSEATFDFLDDVLSEVMGIFPVAVHPRGRGRSAQGALGAQPAGRGVYGGPPDEQRGPAAELLRAADREVHRIQGPADDRLGRDSGRRARAGCDGDELARHRGGQGGGQGGS